MSQSVQYSGREFLTALILCQRQAFEHFYDLYAPVIYGLVYRITKDEKATQRLMQDVFAELLKEIKNYDPENQTLLCWSLVIARRVACAYNNDIRATLDPICK